MRAIETLISAWIAEQERRERVLRRLERETPAPGEPERDAALRGEPAIPPDR